MNFRDSLDSFFNTFVNAGLSEEITYIRGVQNVVIDATPGNSTFQISDFGQVKFVKSDRDWIFKAELLNFGNGPVLPEEGDSIEWVNGDFIETYFVSSPPDEPEFRYCDPMQIGLRVYCKFDSKVAI